MKSPTLALHFHFPKHTWDGSGFGHFHVTQRNKNLNSGYDNKTYIKFQSTVSLLKEKKNMIYWQTFQIARDAQEMRFKQIGIPSCKLTVCYGKRPISFDDLLMKHDKHGDFSWFPMGFPWFSIAMFWVPIHLSRPTQGPNGTLPQLLKHIPWPSARPSRKEPRCWVSARVKHPTPWGLPLAAPHRPSSPEGGERHTLWRETSVGLAVFSHKTWLKKSWGRVTLQKKQLTFISK